MISIAVLLAAISAFVLGVLVSAVRYAMHEQAELELDEALLHITPGPGQTTGVRRHRVRVVMARLIVRQQGVGALEQGTSTKRGGRGA